MLLALPTLLATVSQFFVFFFFLGRLCVALFYPAVVPNSLPR